ncbi:MAG: phosphomannomutase/phosphoglucomutase [Burkholderiales bacterium]|nr:phosphomannomutase/phosphoglucomutase [Burkholderiales bacterium]MCA3154889.1 phosphomannomutase/phosphoglucomutase [Burkholderiales bacterium]MCA3156074.1 phosphomannomutase/phosphoglucomutase [Burkholderiales bacterium]MCA3158808.1 phosphomannomutase/phosphoglucomutase [Burkholderiales bacterium]MCA3161992.1 phosphomannomutase/phosphoglucomutase [Burkholderiales bacterium]
MIAGSIFKAYDIRGVVDKTLTLDAVRQIGQAIATLARERGDRQAVVGRDGRLSGPGLLAALAQGLQAGGLDVIDLGEVATPMVYFAVHELQTGTGVMVTGSHNPPEYNGLKMVVGNEAIYGATIQALRQHIESGQLAQGTGSYRQENIAQRYLQRIVGDIQLARPMKLAIDCGNGVPGAYAPALFRALGCEVTELFCEVDGRFPNHHPDPAQLENLQDLMRCLRETDNELGFAFDGDGDRLGVVTKDGQVIFPDRQMMLFARDVLSRQPGAEIIYDVKCSRLLGDDIRRAGGRALMWKTGHSLVKAKLKETGAPLAGEMSGHIFFKERWYGFDDGLYAGARLLEIVSRAPDANAVLNALPNSAATPELHLHCAEGENHALIERLQREVAFPQAREVVTIDGVRAEYADGFGLARASNTTPVVVLRFEADHAQALARIQQEFKHALLRLKPDAALPF